MSITINGKEYPLMGIGDNNIMLIEDYKVGYMTPSFFSEESDQSSSELPPVPDNSNAAHDYPPSNYSASIYRPPTHDQRASGEELPPVPERIIDLPKLNVDGSEKEEFVGFLPPPTHLYPTKYLSFDVLEFDQPLPPPILPLDPSELIDQPHRGDEGYVQKKQGFGKREWNENYTNTVSVEEKTKRIEEYKRKQKEFNESNLPIGTPLIVRRPCEKSLQSLSDEQIVLYRTDPIYYHYINNCFLCKIQNPKELRANKSIYSPTIPSKDTIDFENESMRKLKKYVINCLHGFNPVLENYPPSTVHPIHSILYKISKDLLRSQEELTLSEKIQYCEQAISEIVYFCIEGDDFGFSKEKLREYRDKGFEIGSPSANRNPSWELLEIALRNHIMFAILDQDKTQISKQFAKGNELFIDIEDSSKKLYQFVTKNGNYKFEYSTICQQIIDCIVDFNSHEIARDIFKHCNQPIVSEKIKYCESAISKFASFYTKITSLPTAPLDPQDDEWELITESESSSEWRKLEIDLRKQLMFWMLNQEKTRIYEQFAKKNKFPRDIEEHCNQLHAFVTNGGMCEFEISEIYEKLTDDVSINAIIDKIVEEAIPEHRLGLSYVESIKDYITHFENRISLHLNKSRPDNSSHPESVFERKLRRACSRYLSAHYASDFRALFDANEIAFPTNDDYRNASEMLAEFAGGKNRYITKLTKRLLLKQTFGSFEKIQLNIETEKKNLEILQNDPSADKIPSLLSRLSNPQLSIHELEILGSKTRRELAQGKLTTLEWAKNQREKLFPEDIEIPLVESFDLIELHEKYFEELIPTEPKISLPPVGMKPQPVVQPKHSKATDRDIPLVSYVDIVFREHLNQAQSGSDYFKSLPEMVQMDVLRRVNVYGNYNKGKTEEIVGRLYKNINDVEKEFKRLKKKKRNFLRSHLKAEFIRDGLKLLELYYSPGKNTNFAHLFQTLPYEKLFYQYVYEMAKEAGVHIESWDLNFAENNFIKQGMIPLSIQALERCLHSSPAPVVVYYQGPGKLSIRGEGPGMSWEKGIELKNIGEGTFILDSTNAKTDYKFKILLNDQQWMHGENVIAKSGEPKHIWPKF